MNRLVAAVHANGNRSKVHRLDANGGSVCNLVPIPLPAKYKPVKRKRGQIPSSADLCTFCFADTERAAPAVVTTMPYTGNPWAAHSPECPAGHHSRRVYRWSYDPDDPGAWYCAECQTRFTPE